MDVIGIICEYNPFHNGHVYHINKIKELYPNSLIVLVLNGLFLERGEMSILTKETKTRLALQYGIDLVLELPVIYGTQSADTFADKAVTILNIFGVNKIIIGSENNDSSILMKIANIELNNPNFNIKVKEYLSLGNNYPTSLAKALDINFDFKPNDLLGISYAKSIVSNGFKIELLTIKRTNDYHDTKSNAKIISAQNIREKLKNNIDISNYVPYDINKLNKNINYDNLFILLKYKINTENLSKILDVDEGIEYRLKKYINSANNINDFISLVKTKRYTYNKINRLLIHILLNIPKDINNIELSYIKILGFNENGKDYLNSIKKELLIPTEVNKESSLYKYELRASIVYDLINNTNTKDFELRNKPIIK